MGSHLFSNIGGVQNAVNTTVSLTNVEFAHTGSPESQKFAADMTEKFTKIMASIERSGRDAVMSATIETPRAVLT